MIDQIIYEGIKTIQSPPLTKLIIAITSIGDVFFLAILSILLIAYLIYKKEYIKNKIFILTMALGAVITQILKETIQRARPTEMLIEKDGFSFPSGHTTMSMAFFGMLIFIFKDEIKNKYNKYLFVITNVLLILAISFSRLYLNVHWFTDVISSILIGLICIFGSIIIVKKIPFLNKNKLL